jgi:hypothetical protein
MKIFTLAALMFLATITCAQTIGPLQAECGAHCSGSFHIINNQVIPMVVTIQTSVVTFADGHPVFHNADGLAEVKVNAMSARLSPKQDYVFDYKVRCAQVPCVANFAAVMTTALHTDTGIAVNIMLSHVAYSCAKSRGCRIQTLQAAGLLK